METTRFKCHIINQWMLLFICRWHDWWWRWCASVCKYNNSCQYNGYKSLRISVQHLLRARERKRVRECMCVGVLALMCWTRRAHTFKIYKGQLVRIDFDTLIFGNLCVEKGSTKCMYGHFLHLYNCQIKNLKEKHFL